LPLHQIGNIKRPQENNFPVSGKVRYDRFAPSFTFVMSPKKAKKVIDAVVFYRQGAPMKINPTNIRLDVSTVCNEMSVLSTANARLVRPSDLKS